MPAKPPAPAKPESASPDAAEPAVVETPAAEPAELDAPAPDTSGWYRNRAQTPLLVQPDQYPSTLLDPGAATWLPADPQHPDLEPCDAPPPSAADADTKEQ